MESTQILIIIIVSVLALILAAIGVQIFLILKEVTKSLQKFNTMLDDGNLISNTVARSITGISGVITGVKAGLSFLNFFKKDAQKEEYGEEE